MPLTDYIALGTLIFTSLVNSALLGLLYVKLDRALQILDRSEGRLLGKLIGLEAGRGGNAP